MLNGLMTTEELAEWLKLSPRQVNSLARAGKLPSIKAPRALLWNTRKTRYYFDPELVWSYMKGETPDQRAIRAARKVK